jgi:hypothetical protein
LSVELKQVPRCTNHALCVLSLPLLCLLLLLLLQELLLVALVGLASALPVFFLQVLCTAVGQFFRAARGQWADWRCWWAPSGTADSPLGAPWGFDRLHG